MKSKFKTQNKMKYGCLSKTLVSFLSSKDHEIRKKKYGIKTAKYYERVIQHVNESFNDHLLALMQLPDEYRKKINLMQSYDNLINTAITKKWIEEPPDTFLKETYNHMIHFQNHLPRTPYEHLAENDFEKVIRWLELFIFEMKIKSKKRRSV